MFIACLIVLYVVVFQGKYLFGDYSMTFFVADAYIYGGGTNFLDKWPWKTVQLYEKNSRGRVVSYRTNELYSFGIDRSNELYGLTSSGIFRVTDSANCRISC